MENISDKTQCKRLLRTREAGGHKFESFFRANFGSHLLFLIYFTFGLMFLAPACSLAAFLFVAFLFITIVFRDVIRFIQIRRNWPFLCKIINWDEVKKISEDEPSA